VDLKIVRRKLATALLIAALSLALVGLALLGEITSNSENFGQVYPYILLINGVGSAVLLLLIGANLLRLFRDHSRNVPGARLKSRLVTAFVLLLVGPLVVVYLFAVQFLNEGIDSWFDVEIEQGLGDALDLSRAALDMRMRVRKCCSLCAEIISMSLWSPGPMIGIWFEPPFSFPVDQVGRSGFSRDCIR